MHPPTPPPPSSPASEADVVRPKLGNAGEMIIFLISFLLCNESRPPLVCTVKMVRISWQCGVKMQKCLRPQNLLKHISWGHSVPANTEQIRTFSGFSQFFVQCTKISFCRGGYPPPPLQTPPPCNLPPPPGRPSFPCFSS